MSDEIAAIRQPAVLALAEAHAKNRALAEALLIARNTLEALRPFPLVIDGRVAAIIAQADAAMTPRPVDIADVCTDEK